MRWMKCWKTSTGRASPIKLLFRLLLFPIAAAVLLLPQKLFAQETPAQEPTFRSQSNIVLVPALVRDASGHAVYGLQAKDFILEDNGVAQPVHLEEQAEAEPLSLVVALQTGRSASREFPRMRGLSSMLDPILEEPQTQVAIVEFDSQIKLAQDFTENVGRVDRVLQNLEGGDGGAVILDTVKYSVGLLNKLPPERRRVLLLISEQRDHGSRWAKIDELVTLIGNSNVTVYSLTFSPTLSNILDTERGNNQDEMNAGPDLLALVVLAREAMRKNAPRAIASETGGEHELFATRASFENRLIDFTNHLHSRYLLSFEPKNPQPGLHRIYVRLAEPGNKSVVARSRYWASAGPQ